MTVGGGRALQGGRSGVGVFAGRRGTFGYRQPGAMGKTVGNTHEDPLAAFFRSLKTITMYPEGSEAARAVCLRFLSKLQPLLLRAGEVRLLFGPDSVTLSAAGAGAIALEASLSEEAGEGSREGQGKDTELASTLYEAGLRELGFLRGLDGEELEGLLGLLGKAARGRLDPTDEDLSVLLWEMDLPHVTYRAVDIAEVAPPPLSLESRGADGEIAEAWERLHPIERYLARSGALEEAELEVLDLEVSETDLAGLRREVKEDRARLGAKFALILPELLACDLEARELDHLLTVMEEQGMRLLEQGAFGALNVFASRLADALNGTYGNQLKRIGAALLGPEAAERALSALRTGVVDDAEAAIEYLSGLREEGIALLLAAASTQEHRGVASAVLAGALARVLEERPQILLQRLGAADPRQLRYLAGILASARIRVPSGLWEDSLAALLEHDSARVRVEALRLAAALGHPRLEKMLVRSVSDPEGEVRVTAAELLSRRFKAKALSSLLQIVVSEGFEERSFEEQVAFFEALARSSPGEVFPILAGTLKRRALFGRRRLRARKACALRALGEIPIEMSGPLLMKYRNSKDPLLAESARRALERHRERMQTSGDSEARESA